MGIFDEMRTFEVYRDNGSGLYALAYIDDRPIWGAVYNGYWDPEDTASKQIMADALAFLQWGEDCADWGTGEWQSLYGEYDNGEACAENIIWQIGAQLDAGHDFIDLIVRMEA